MNHFTELAISQPLLTAIEKLGFKTPTPIQAQTIPVVLDKKDVISLAETGSGKTAAYLIPMIEFALKNPEFQTLILAPTRELAVQIGDVFKTLSPSQNGIRHVVLIGGQPMSKQLQVLKFKPRFIVATPGRLIDHLNHRSVDLKKTSCLILDEADRMFDMGFAPQVNRIVQMIPRERQTLLFSATFPNEIRDLANRVLRNPIEIEVRKENKAPVVIEQKMLLVPNAEKNDKLLDLINAAKGSVLVFTRTKHRTNKVCYFLEEYGVKVTRIHGDRTQAQRTRSIAEFKSGVYNVLVATDIAARGLDVSSITDVINYDIPMTVEDYTHRIGRTGRAGQAGQALTMITPEDKRDWDYIARKMSLSQDMMFSPQGQNGTQQKPQYGRNKQGHQNNRSGQSRDGGQGRGGFKPRGGGFKSRSGNGKTSGNGSFRAQNNRNQSQQNTAL